MLFDCFNYLLIRHSFLPGGHVFTHSYCLPKAKVLWLRRHMIYTRRTSRYLAILPKNRPVVSHRAGDRRDPTMSTNASNSQKRTAVRPTAFYVGEDARGRVHYYHTPTESVHVAAAGERVRHVQCEPGTERDLDAYAAAVARERGWSERHYGVALHHAIDAALED